MSLEGGERSSETTTQLNSGSPSPNIFSMNNEDQKLKIVARYIEHFFR